MFGFAPDGSGTMALGAKVKMGDKLKKLSVFSEGSVRDNSVFSVSRAERVVSNEKRGKIES
jgi:hypothetical protein